MAGGRRLRTALLFLGGLALAAVLPLIGRAARGGGEERCALDGVAVQAPTRVRIRDEDGTVRSFCCVDCARSWLDRQPEAPRRIQVTDEVTGREILAGEATFVESRVVSFAVTGCRIHVFADPAEAARHVREFGGAVLEGDHVPFARPRREER